MTNINSIKNTLVNHQHSILCKYGEFTEDDFVFFSQMPFWDFITCKVLGWIIMYVDKAK